MSFARANGIAIRKMRMRLVSRDAWSVVDLELDTEEVPAVGAAITIEAPGGKFVGTVELSGKDGAGVVTVRVRGGAGQLSKALEPRSYTGTTAGEVAKHIATDAGERLSSTIAADVLDYSLGKWLRYKGAGATALSDLADELGATWRVLPDGTIWLGRDAGDEPSFDYDVSDDRPGDGVLVVALESLSLLPGQTFRAGPVVEVHYLLGGSTFTAKVVRTEGGDAGTKRIDARVEKAAAKTRLHPPTGAKVVSQNADGTLELKVDSASMPSISKVPIRHGLPGVTRLEVATGTRVALFFEDGDRKRPFAGLFSGGRTTKVVVDGDKFEWGGTKAVALDEPWTAWANTVESRLAGLGAPGAGPVGTDSKKLFTE